MKTRLFKSPLLALACLAPVAAFAQDASAVRIYGVLDAGAVSEHNCADDACPSTKLSPGVSTGSVVGVKGSEDLGHDTRAVFTLEAGVRNDTGQSDQGGRLFGSQAYVGLANRWGALTVGRQYDIGYETLTEVADPFHGGTAGTATNLMGNGSKRSDNAIKYRSGSDKGVVASAMYSFGESAFSTSRNRAYGAMIGYEGGLFSLRAAYQRKNNFLQGQGSTAPVDLSARNSLVAANLHIAKSATIYAGYAVNRGVGSSPWDQDNPYGALVLVSPSNRTNDALAGVSYAQGAATYMVSVIHKDDRTMANMDADQVAVGMTYAMSRRTAFYAAYSRIKDSNNAPYTVGNFSEQGKGRSAFNLGMRHAF
ncbi:putative porin [Pseudoduganella lurida]|uniref:Putative porin n=1 Tax=Pseudoduganella lurida TaxID=1036180 RepID=A0A562RM77_9BURK|nr:porin [Pseudoduganella lurida]TWI70158.1 putative porin [Pseudoduganella lurida]